MEALPRESIFTKCCLLCTSWHTHYCSMLCE